VNVRHDPAAVEALAAAGVETVEFDPAAERDPDRAAVRAALDGRDPGDRLALYQTGAVGVEPILYVLAADAPAAVRLACDHVA
jgi:predicted fused transcriptional regulator/phosphomethylpyrimidine kinase